VIRWGGGEVCRTAISHHRRAHASGLLARRRAACWDDELLRGAHPPRDGDPRQRRPRGEAQPRVVPQPDAQHVPGPHPAQHDRRDRAAGVRVPVLGHPGARIEPLSAYLPRRVRLGPFPSLVDMRRLLGRYYHGDANRTEDLPITEDWRIAAGTPFRIQCLFAYGSSHARRADEPCVTAEHVERAWRDIQTELPRNVPR